MKGATIIPKNTKLYSFDKSGYKSDEELDEVYDRKINEKFSGRITKVLSEEEKKEYDQIVTESMKDPRRKNVYFDSEEKALEAKEKADTLEQAENS